MRSFTKNNGYLKKIDAILPSDVKTIKTTGHHEINFLRKFVAVFCILQKFTYFYNSIHLSSNNGVGNKYNFSGFLKILNKIKYKIAIFI